jgi:hypothetical protein
VNGVREKAFMMVMGYRARLGIPRELLVAYNQNISCHSPLSFTNRLTAERRG